MHVEATPRSPIKDRIRWARKHAGLSQEKLAQQTGLTRRHVMRLERGDVRNPNPNTRRVLAETTGQPEELFRGDEDEEDALSIGDALTRAVRHAVRQELRASA